MTALLLIAVVVLIFVNGFFVAAEFALVRARRARLEELAEEGDRRRARARCSMLDDLNEYLSACQFGITLASLGIGFLGEPAIATLVRAAVRRRSRTASPSPISVAIAYILVTAGHIIVGEQVPKIYAIVNAETSRRRVARPLDVFNSVMRPVHLAAQRRRPTRSCGCCASTPTPRSEEGATPEELRC